MRKCARCGLDEEKQFRRTKLMFKSAFGFCDECHEEFASALRALRKSFVDSHHNLQRTFTWIFPGG